MKCISKCSRHAEDARCLCLETGLARPAGHWAGHWAIVWAMGRGPAGAPRHTYKMFRKFQIDKSAAGGRGALNYDDARDKVLSRNNILTRQLGTVKMQYQSTFS